MILYVQARVIVCQPPSNQATPSIQTLYLSHYGSLYIAKCSFISQISKIIDADAFAQ